MAVCKYFITLKVQIWYLNIQTARSKFKVIERRVRKYKVKYIYTHSNVAIQTSLINAIQRVKRASLACLFKFKSSNGPKKEPKLGPKRGTQNKTVAPVYNPRGIEEKTVEQKRKIKNERERETEKGTKKET